jgi:hypothetical protein
MGAFEYGGLGAQITSPATDPYVKIDGGGTISFTGTAIGGTAPYSYAWDYEYSGSFSTDQTGSSGSHSYANGEHTAALRVTDNASGTALDTVTILVYDNGGTPSDYSDDSDWDSDGLPDGWELFYFNDFDEDDTGDPDGDGADNLTEYNAGTDPTHNDTQSSSSSGGTSGGCSADGGEGAPLAAWGVALMMIVALCNVFPIRERGRARLRVRNEERRQRP